MIFLGEITHYAVLLKFITLVVIATSQTFQFSGFYSYLPLGVCALHNRVRAAAKISAGGGGSPYNQLYPVSYPTSSTNYGSEDI